MCSAVSTAAAFAGGIRAHVSKTFVHGKMLKSLALTWLIGNTVADLMITAAMIYHLTSRNSAGDGHFSCHALSRIVRLTVETNILTATNGLVSLLLAVIFPYKSWYACPTAILGKLYSNTLLVSLNNRISIRDESFRRGALPRHRTFTATSSRMPSGILPVGLEKFSHTFKEGTESGENETHERIIDISSFGASKAGQDTVI